MKDLRPIAVTDLAAEQESETDGYVRLQADEPAWVSLAKGCAAGLQDLSALWFDAGQMRMALLDPGRQIRAIVSLALRKGYYPSVGRHHAPAIRLERAMHDLYATHPAGLPDSRPWLDHGVWPERPKGYGDETEEGGKKENVKPYEFLRAKGESLHQVPVGPVHAGTIEPGHFRFTVNGETVVRLEQRFGYAHKGVETLCAGAPVEQAARIAARISGDCTVAYSFAFARAVEAALGWRPPERAVLIRGIMAEIERLANHIGDVGGICNDASVMAIQARCSLIREEILQTADFCFGHRLMMDRVVPGGVTHDLNEKGAAAIRDRLTKAEAAFNTAVRVYEQSASLQNRTVTAGIAQEALTRQFAAGGYVGRASGRAFDARAAFPYPPYDAVAFETPTRSAGDVDARIWIRVEEIRESAKIVRQLLNMLRPGPIHTPSPPLRPSEGVALVEAFRGDAFVFVRLGEGGRIAQFHARDPSWFQWPLLEAAIEGNIIADFPLCNKSFNCSYSGPDL